MVRRFEPNSKEMEEARTNILDYMKDNSPAESVIQKIERGNLPDTGDMANISAVVEDNLAATEISAKQRTEIKRAWEKTLTGAYFICDGTHYGLGSGEEHEISNARLQAYPIATMCKNCREQLEKRPASRHAQASYLTIRCRRSRG